MSNTNVYVTGLPDGLDDTSFRQLFEGYGSIMSTKLFADKKYGFVKFMSVEEATYVVSSFNGQQVGSSTLLVKFANNDSSGGKGGGKDGGKGPGSFGKGGCGAATAVDQVYVKGLPAGMTQDELQATFSAYGSIKWCKLLVADGKPDCAAMVQMNSPDEAQWLVDNLNGNIPQGLVGPVEVKMAAPKSKGFGKGKDKGGYGPMKGGKGGMMGMAGPYGGGAAVVSLGGGGGKGIQPGDESNLYVKGLPPSADDLYLYKLFAPFGAIASVKAVIQETFAIGFVKFVQVHEAQAAIANLNGAQTPEGTMLQVSVKASKPGGGKGGSSGKGGCMGMF